VRLPAVGGRTADVAWQVLGVKGRGGVGGLPCELVHGSVGVQTGFGNSCTTNAGMRFVKAALRAVAIYFPVNTFLSIALFQTDLKHLQGPLYPHPVNTPPYSASLTRRALRVSRRTS